MFRRARSGEGRRTLMSLMQQVALETLPGGQRLSSQTKDTGRTIRPPDGPVETGENTRRRYLLHRFWQAARGFWGRKGPRAAWVLSGLTLLAVLANLAALYGINVWNRALFDGLEKHEASWVLFLSLIYFPLMATSVFLNVMQVYGRMTLQRCWRAWLNNQLVE